MDGSTEDAGAPESWESADLEEGVKRLLISHPSVVDSGRTNQPLEFSDDEPAPSLPAAVVPSLLSASLSGASIDAINQVDQFLREAIQNPRERLSILRMEQDVEKFMRDTRQQQLEFLQLPTSYLRLAAHRIAQHYNLQSMVMHDNNSTDSSTSKIVLWKTPGCRLPLIRLADIPVNLPQDDSSKVAKVAIKQRPQKVDPTMINANHQYSKSNHLKSVEERKEEYNRARARIFRHNNTDSAGVNVRPESELSLGDSLQHGPSILTKVENIPFFEGSEGNCGKSFGESSSGALRSTRNKSDRETVGRSKPNNRVAIFRDRELDRKDPDYDRNYDRYLQRFDPGFGFNAGPYPVQPLYSPALNYNTEFPQLGAAAHRPQISLEHTPRPVTQQHPHGPWTTTGSATAINYTPNDSMMAPFNSTHAGAHTSSPIYLQSPQYGYPSGLPFLHPNESVQQPFAQPHQQQSEASFGLARPR